MTRCAGQESDLDETMTPKGFRRIALGWSGAVESAHHDHPDFRVGGRIFATLGYPDRHWGALNLTVGRTRRHDRTAGRDRRGDPGGSADPRLAEHGREEARPRIDATAPSPHHLKVKMLAADRLGSGALELVVL